MSQPPYRGCLYLMPSTKLDHDVVAYLWVTDAGDDLERTVLEFAKQWLCERWPFERPVFPRAEIGLDDFDRLPDGRSYPHQAI